MYFYPLKKRRAIVRISDICILKSNSTLSALSIVNVSFLDSINDFLLINDDGMFIITEDFGGNPFPQSGSINEKGTISFQ
jgi:hypothetical protein